MTSTIAKVTGKTYLCMQSRDGDLLTLSTYMQFLLDLEPEIVMLEKIDTDELTRLAREMLGK